MERREAREAIQQPRSVAAAITGCLASASAAQTDAEMTMYGTKMRLSCLENAARSAYTTNSRQECLIDSGKWRMSARVPTGRSSAGSARVDGGYQ